MGKSRSGSESFNGADLPSCSITSIKKRARMIRSEFDPEGEISLFTLHVAVGRCLGLDCHLVFSHRQSANPVFPKNLPSSEYAKFQQQREISVLAELLPHLAPTRIDEFVSNWVL